MSSPCFQNTLVMTTLVMTFLMLSLFRLKVIQIKIIATFIWNVVPKLSTNQLENLNLLNTFFSNSELGNDT